MILFEDIQNLDMSLDTTFIKVIKDILAKVPDGWHTSAFFDAVKVYGLDRAIIKFEEENKDLFGEDGEIIEQIVADLWSVRDTINDAILEEREGEEKVTTAGRIWEKKRMRNRDVLVRDEDEGLERQVRICRTETPTVPMPNTDAGYGKKWVWDPDAEAWIAVDETVDRIARILAFEEDMSGGFRYSSTKGDMEYRKLDDVPTEILLRQLDELTQTREERELSPEETSAEAVILDELEYRGVK